MPGGDQIPHDHQTFSTSRLLSLCSSLARNDPRQLHECEMALARAADEADVSHESLSVTRDLTVRLEVEHRSRLAVEAQLQGMVQKVNTMSTLPPLCGLPSTRTIAIKSKISEKSSRPILVTLAARKQQGAAGHARQSSARSGQSSPRNFGGEAGRCHVQRGGIRVAEQVWPGPGGAACAEDQVSVSGESRRSTPRR